MDGPTIQQRLIGIFLPIPIQIIEFMCPDYR